MNGAGFSKSIGILTSSLGSISKRATVFVVMVTSSWLKFLTWTLVAWKLANKVEEERVEERKKTKEEVKKERKEQEKKPRKTDSRKGRKRARRNNEMKL